MSARRAQRCAVGRALLVLTWMSATLVSRGNAQKSLPAATEQPQGQINALAERLALQFLAAGKKHPFVLDLTLPNDASCPLGVWLADQISERLAQAHPELEVISRRRWNSVAASLDSAHDLNQEFAQREQQRLFPTASA